MAKKKQKTKKPHYPPSYINYHKAHPTISICVNKKLKEIINKLKDNVYLFSLELNFRNHLKRSSVNGDLENAFKNNNSSLSINTPIKKIGEKKWRIKDGIKEYTIWDTSKVLNVYEKMSYARFFEHILDKNVDYLKKHHQEYIKGYYEAIERYRIWNYCVKCNKKIWIIPNTEVHKRIIEFLKDQGWAHGACLQANKKAKKQNSV